MTVSIRGENYDCRTAIKKGNVVILYLGEYDEYGNENTSVFYDFPDEDIIGVEDKPSQLDKIEAQVTYNSMILGTLIEEV